MENKNLTIVKPKILILCDYYLPGYKSGGGMRTIVNMVDSFSHIYDFWIITRDHDGKLDRDQYQSVKIDDWNEVKNAKVIYLSKINIKISKLMELLLTVEPDILYFNSYFSTLTIYTLTLLKLKLVKNRNKIVSPCGELSQGGLSLNTHKKKLFMGFARKTGLFKKVIWKASSNFELAEITQNIGKNERVFIAPDLLPKQILSDYNPKSKPIKKPGMAHLVFLSRFMRKKNFKFLLEILFEVKGELLIDVWGPLEDLSYWEECQEIIKTLPSNIKIEAKGPIPFESVASKLMEYHFFVLPTLGENFGHVFLEALAAGCPLLISDRTPWVNLEVKQVGWDISLENKILWKKTINKIISLDAKTYSHLSIKSRNFALQLLGDPKITEATKKVLDYALAEN